MLVFSRLLSSKFRYLAEHPLVVGAKSDLEFFASIFELGKNETEKLLQENKFLKQLNRKEMMKTMEFLKYVGISLKDMRYNVAIFRNDLKTIENRSMIFQESGFEGINLEVIEKYDDVINESVDNLKAKGFIPHDLQVMEFLSKEIVNKQTSMGLLFVDVNINLSTDEKLQFENISLREMRIGVLKLLLSNKLELKDKEAVNLLHEHPKVIEKSFDSIFKVIDILEFDYKFTMKAIVENFYLLLADPENLIRLKIDVNKILDLELKEIAVKEPKVLLVSVENMKEISLLLAKVPLNTNKLRENLYILTLNRDLVVEECKKLK